MKCRLVIDMCKCEGFIRVEASNSLPSTTPVITFFLHITSLRLAAKDCVRDRETDSGSNRHLMKKEGNVLFNDALNTFYLRLYGVGRSIEDHSGRGEPSVVTWVTRSDMQKELFYMNHLTNRTAHTTANVTPLVDHWLERDIAQWVHHEGSISRPITPRSYISFILLMKNARMLFQVIIFIFLKT